MNMGGVGKTLAPQLTAEIGDTRRFKAKRALFLVMNSLMQKSNPAEPVFQFISKKRPEGKHYCVYVATGGNKFLSINYARVIEILNSSER